MAADRARLAPVDGLRGFAILIVILTHIHQAVGYPYIAYSSVFASVDFARSGVDLFFVLSGFCLFYPLTKPGARPRWGNFFFRRARRLLPGYYAAIVLLLVLPFVLSPLAGKLGLVVAPAGLPTWDSIWKHLLIIHTLFYNTFYDFDGPMWSLGIEIQFYLAFPLAVWLVFRFGWRGVALIAAATIGYRMLVNSPVYNMAAWPVDVVDLFPSRWMEFALGMLVAIQVRRTGDAPLSWRREVSDFAGILVIYALGAYCLYGPAADWPYAHKDLLFSACYAILVYLACRRGSLLGRLFSNPALVLLGTISYSVYLIHFPIIFALAPSVVALHLSNVANVVVLAAIAIPVILVASTAFFLLFERPFLNTAPTGLAQALPEHGRLAAWLGRVRLPAPERTRQVATD